jgi:ABC-type dipeptide/oligopeptide/nickel transport system ATPase component
MERALIEVKDLKVQFKLRRGAVRAVDGISFSIADREVLGIVGETGYRKSVTALSILPLIPSPGEIIGGEIIFAGEDLLKKSEKAIE